MGFRVALLAIPADRADAVFDHYGLQTGRRVPEIPAGEGLEEPLKSMIVSMGSIATPAIGYDISGDFGVFAVDLKQLKPRQTVDADTLSLIAPVWMLEVHENSSASFLSRHYEGKTTCRIEAAFTTGIDISGDCPFDLDEHKARNEAEALELSARSGEIVEAQENYIPQNMFADLTKGVTYANEFSETMYEVLGALPLKRPSPQKQETGFSGNANAGTFDARPPVKPWWKVW